MVYVCGREFECSAVIETRCRGRGRGRREEDPNMDHAWLLKESVNASLWNALTHPFVKDAVESGKLGLHGAYFDFVRGSFQFWTFNYNLTEPESF